MTGRSIKRPSARFYGIHKLELFVHYKSIFLEFLFLFLFLLQFLFNHVSFRSNLTKGQTIFKMRFNFASLNETGGRYCTLLLIFLYETGSGKHTSDHALAKKNGKNICNIRLIKLPGNKGSSVPNFDIS